mmetsp:Transcript_22932/g.49944  ORF Transcript_22932/g.49944 Transcript_22932/m.49944 type:complete len:300 (+) Transcript_22932:152-1051(+)
MIHQNLDILFGVFGYDFDDGIHLVGFVESLALHFIVIEARQAINLELEGVFESFLLVVGDGRGNLGSEFLDVGDDVFATARIRFLHVGKRLESGRQVFGSDGTGGKEGGQRKVVVGVEVIGMSLGSTFFGGSDVNFIVLESHGLALNPSEEPCSIADTGGLEKESGLEEYKDNRVTQESNGEAGCNQLPCDGSENGSGDGSHESQVEHLLDTIRDTKDVLVFTNNNVDSGDTGDNEEAKSDSHLATAHETGKILSSILEKAVASSQGHTGRSTFGLRKFGDSEKSDLHTFEKTDAAHQN